MRQNRRGLEERLRSAKEKLREYRSSALDSELSQRSVEYSKAISGLLSMELELADLLRTRSDLEFWDRGFGNKGIKSLIIREALPSLNAKLAEYSDEIFGGTVDLEFSPSKISKGGNERELFSVAYRSKRGSDSYLGESSGGRKRVDICVLLCFSWLSRSSNLLLVDELLDSLDQSGRESVLEILRRQRGTVLVISHRRELKSHIGKVWTVVKQKGFSRLEGAA